MNPTLPKSPDRHLAVTGRLPDLIQLAIAVSLAGIGEIFAERGFSVLFKVNPQFVDSFIALASDEDLTVQEIIKDASNHPVRFDLIHEGTHGKKLVAKRPKSPTTE